MPAIKGRKLSPEHREKIRIAGLGRRHSKSSRGKIGLANTKHGLSQTQFWNVFKCLRARCRNENDTSYKNYGGRGIKNKWESFEDFINDMYESYLEHVKEYGKGNTTIERINNNGNYCKENCRWATRQEQNNNTRANVFLSHNGITMTIRQWNKKLGFSVTTLRGRLDRGWNLEKALTEPLYGKYDNTLK